MARKRMEDPSLKSWDEVNAALKLIRDNEIELELIEADMGKKIADIKEQAAEQAVPYRDDIKKLELQVKEFVTLNKAELKGKSREMDFGKVGFRMSTKLMLPKQVEKVIKTLKKYGMGDCITVKESLVSDLYLHKAVGIMLGMKKRSSPTPEAIGVAKALRLAVRLREFDEMVRERGDESYKISEQYDYIKDILEA